MTLIPTGHKDPTPHIEVIKKQAMKICPFFEYANEKKKDIRIVIEPTRTIEKETPGIDTTLPKPKIDITDVKFVYNLTQEEKEEAMLNRKIREEANKMIAKVMKIHEQEEHGITRGTATFRMKTREEAEAELKKDMAEIDHKKRCQARS